MGALCVVTLPAPNEVESSWFNAFEVIRPGRRLTFRCGSSLLLRTGALTHTVWSGSLLGFMLARFDLNPPCEAANILLNVSVRLALWTCQFTVVPRAMWIDFDMTVHHGDMVSVHHLGACNPLLCQLHPNSKFVV